MGFSTGTNLSFSTKSRYSILILVDLAMLGRDKPRNVHDISTARHISKKYVSQLMIPLRDAGYVKAVRGPNGGYLLLKEPDAITALEIVDLMDGELHLCECCSRPESCDHYHECKTYGLWKGVDEKVRAAFESLRIQDLVDCFTPEEQEAPMRIL